MPRIPVPLHLPALRPDETASLSASAAPATLVLRTLAAVGLLLMMLAPSLQPSAAAAATRPFAATSPFNVPIKTAPVVDAKSSAMVARATRNKLVYANLVEFGIPIYSANATTPKVPVTCSYEGTWGKCPLNAQPVPIPAGARPHHGSDGAMVVVDGTTSYEFWQARPGQDAWTASWGAVNSLSGTGWTGASTGAGASRAAGVVRVSEIESGVIPHALVLQSDNVCAKVFRAPAWKTDGDSSRTDCIPEGTRLQLDPKINLNTLPLTKGEKAVARALQVYGAYLIDRGGAPLSVSFELAPDASGPYPGAVYAAAGMGWDYYGMPNVPWTKLRVLKTWNG